MEYHQLAAAPKKQQQKPSSSAPRVPAEKAAPAKTDKASSDESARDSNEPQEAWGRGWAWRVKRDLKIQRKVRSSWHIAVRC
jgi:hypothetical protein